MNVTPVMVVARKELKDGFRDRRSIYTVFLTALFGPLLITFMLSQEARQKKAAEEIRIPVVGREFAPVLVNWLEQQSGVEVVPGPSDPETAVRDRREDVVLVTKKDFPDEFGQSKAALVQVFTDSTRTSAQPKAVRLAMLLARFSAETASLRLIVRGISPEVASPLKVEDIDVANSQQRAATLLNVILMFLALSVLTAGMQIASDSTAGERERGSLEPLLLNPAPRWQLMAGKWLASSVTALIGLVATLVFISIALSRLKLEELGMRFHLDQSKILLLILTMAPLAVIAPAIQAYLSCFAKSFKEAQSYNVLLVIPVALVGVISTFYPVTNRPWLQLIPFLAQYSLGSEILAGKVPRAVPLVVAGVDCVVLAAIFLWLAARLFSTEKIIFGR
jgi:sodium transport system permease protein